MRALMLALIVGACASPPDQAPPAECFAPWTLPAYESGRAIPAPGPDNRTIETCETVNLLLTLSGYRGPIN